MCEQNFLDLARIDVRAAGNVHIRFAASDVQQATLVHATKVAGVEPAAAQGLGGGFGVTVIPLKNCGAAGTDLADFSARALDALFVENGDFHAGAHVTAGADVGVGVIVIRRMHVRGQNGDVAGDLAKPEILHQHLAELLQREFLVGAVHRGTRVDDVAQRAVIVLIDRRVLDEHLDDRGHGKQVGDAMLLDQLPEGFRIEFFAWQQDRCRAARHVDQRVDAGAMRQRGNHDRAVGLARARNQVGQMIVDDKVHLVMRQNSGLGFAGGARGIEEPEGIARLDGFRLRGCAAVLFDQGFVTAFALAWRTDGNDVTQIAGFSADGVGMLRENILDHHGNRVA